MKYNPFKMLINILTDNNDPIAHCEVYKSKGCAHVDGMMCNMKTCTIRESNKHRQLKQLSDY